MTRWIIRAGLPLTPFGILSRTSDPRFLHIINWRVFLLFYYKVQDCKGTKMSLQSTLKYLTKPHTLRIVTGPSSLSLFRHTTTSDREQWQYMKEYTYLDFSSRYKSWMELDYTEQESFMNRYTLAHQKMTPKHHPQSIQSTVKQMYKDNKDVDFMFFYLYEGLKQHAEQQYKKSREVVVMDDTYDLLVKRDDQ